jgi:hypothetical protein
VLYFLKHLASRFLPTPLFFVVCVSGCGGPADDLHRSTVQGVVTLDGEPLEDGTISFTPTGTTSGPASYGGIVNGKYVLRAGDRGPVLGTHKVQIEAFRDRGQKANDGTPVKEQVIPGRYNQQTTLTAEVSKADNTQDFALTSK